LSASRPLLAYFGHHKSGTRWIDLVLEQLAASASLGYGSVCNPPWFGFDLRNHIAERGIQVLAYTNAEPNYLGQLGEVRGFHVIRDPRDMAVSAYFSHLSSHPTVYWPELIPHRESLSRLSKSDGLAADLLFTNLLPTDGYALRPYDAMAQWDYGADNILEIRFEELISDPLSGFQRILRHLGMKISSGCLAEALASNSFERLSGGRSRGREDASAHYRRGIPGDWRQHFEPRHQDLFLELHGDLVARLGYNTA
jgi:hypothetical protein